MVELFVATDQCQIGDFPYGTYRPLCAVCLVVPGFDLCVDSFEPDINPRECNHRFAFVQGRRDALVNDA